MAQLENITVNGKPLKKFIEREKSDEIQDFIRFELRAMRRPGMFLVEKSRPQQPKLGVRK